MNEATTTLTRAGHYSFRESFRLNGYSVSKSVGGISGLSILNFMQRNISQTDKRIDRYLDFKS